MQQGESLEPDGERGLGSFRWAVSSVGEDKSLGSDSTITHSTEQPGKGSPGTLHPVKAGRCAELPGKRAPTCQGNWGPCSNRCPHAPPPAPPWGALLPFKQGSSIPSPSHPTLFAGRQGRPRGGQGRRAASPWEVRNCPQDLLPSHSLSQAALHLK